MSGFKYISKTWKNGRWNYLYKRAAAVIKFGVNKTKSDYKVTRRESNYVTDKQGKRQWTKPQYVKSSSNLWTAHMRKKADDARQKSNDAWRNRNSSKHAYSIAVRSAQKAKAAEDAYLKRLKDEVNDAEKSYKTLQDKASKAKKRKWYDLANRFNDWANKRDAEEARLRRNGRNQYYQQELRRMRRNKR